MTTNEQIALELVKLISVNSDSIEEIVKKYLSIIKELEKGKNPNSHADNTKILNH